MVADPTRIDDPAVRALAREVVALRRELDATKAGLRATQLGFSSVDDGSLVFKDAAGVQRVSIGKQTDGKFGWGAVNGDAPPQPTPATLTAGMGSITVSWDGKFLGDAPSDFVHVKAYMSPVGPDFIPSDGNCVGHLLGVGSLPVAPLPAGMNYWCRLIAYNTSGAPSTPSMLAGPAAADPVVAASVLDGIVTETKLAAEAVTRAKVAANAIGQTQIADDSISTPKVQARAIDALRIAVGSILAENIAAGQITTDKIAALAVVADKVAANAIQAGHIQAGAITADKLSAVLALVSTLIAGDPTSWRTEIGDPDTPILYWDGTTTGFAVSRDQVTGQANTYMSGRVQFGNGSQIEQDYLDLCEQPATGFQTPKPRQYRQWINTNGATSVTAQWQSATQPGSLCLMAVFQTAVSGTTPPNCGTPAGASIITSQIYNQHRMTLFMVPNATASRTAETFGSSAGSARWGIILAEYRGIAASALDVSAFNWGTGSSAASGTTSTTAQANELQFAAFGSPSIGSGGTWKSPTNGFTKLVEGSGASGLGISAFTRNTTGTGAASTTVSPGASVPWMGVIATFKAATADPTPSRPPAQVVRLFTRSRGGLSTPHGIDTAGNVYPIGRGPRCRVELTRTDAVVVSDTAVGDLFAQGDWAAVDDPYGMVAISSAAGTYSSITIPVTGIYLLRMRTNWQQSSSTAPAISFFTKNSQSATASVMRIVGRFGQGGNDGSPVEGVREVKLNAGDILYWGHYCTVRAFFYRNGVNASAGQNNFGIPTEVSATYFTSV